MGDGIGWSLVSGRVRGFLLAAALTAAAASVNAPAFVAAQGAAKDQRGASPRVGESRQTAGTAEAYAELPNFHRVDGRLYRGAQPRGGGLARLAALGVKTVINLRDDDARAGGEQREARALGLRYFNVPISRAGRPSAERIDELMSIVDAPENQPVFVHCKRGADRTGAFVAAYRITHDGWTGEQALREAESYGMRFWQRGKKDFIRDYYRDHAAPAGKSESRPNATR